MNYVINDLAEENSDMCDRNWEKFINDKVGFDVFNPTLTYQTLTKFDELTGILTGIGHDDFFQATFSED